MAVVLAGPVTRRKLGPSNSSMVAGGGGGSGPRRHAPVIGASPATPAGGGGGTGVGGGAGFAAAVAGVAGPAGRWGAVAGAGVAMVAAVVACPKRAVRSPGVWVPAGCRSVPRCTDPAVARSWSPHRGQVVAPRAVHRHVGQMPPARSVVARGRGSGVGAPRLGRRITFASARVRFPLSPVCRCWDDRPSELCWTWGGWV